MPHTLIAKRKTHTNPASIPANAHINLRHTTPSQKTHQPSSSAKPVTYQDGFIGNGDLILIIMKDTLLTQRQMEILRLRKQGYTQQWIAEKLGTSKANICAIEKSANENIRRAKETLNFLYTLDASELCTLEAGTDLITAPTKIYSAAGLLHIKIKYDTISLITRISATVPEKLKGRQVKENITIYANQDGNLYIE